MESLTSGTFVGTGTFRCRRCSYALTLASSGETLAACPECGGRDFVRASLFGTDRISGARAGEEHEGTLVEAPPADWQARLNQARERISQAGEYLCYEEGGELRTIALTREWTRIGRSLAADVRFDDPTVSRRHALLVRHPDGVRLLDDRSLNGVFVNGARVEGKALKDGDEIIVGRYRLSFLEVVPGAEGAPQAGSGPASAKSAG